MFKRISGSLPWNMSMSKPSFYGDQDYKIISRPPDYRLTLRMETKRYNVTFRKEKACTIIFFTLPIWSTAPLKSISSRSERGFVSDWRFRDVETQVESERSAVEGRNMRQTLWWALDPFTWTQHGPGTKQSPAWSLPFLWSMFWHTRVKILIRFERNQSDL